MHWNVTRTSFTEATLPPSPGFVNTMPAADFATLVAVDTAIPICAWRRAGVSLAPSPHMPTNVAILLECLDEVVFSFRKNARENRKILWAHLGGDWPWRTYFPSSPTA